MPSDVDFVEARNAEVPLADTFATLRAMFPGFSSETLSTIWGLGDSFDALRSAFPMWSAETTREIMAVVA